MKPTQDKELKKYLARTIKSDIGKLFSNVEWQFNNKKEMKEFFDKCATNIQRQLNEMGYVQMPIEKPAIADNPPKPSDKFLTNNDEYFTGIMKRKNKDE